MVNTCAVYGCMSSSKYMDRSFFRFPNPNLVVDDGKRVRQWVQATGRPDLKQKTGNCLYRKYFICDLHFESSNRLGIKKLKPDAVPTLMLPILENGLNPTIPTQTAFVEHVKQKKLTQEIAFQADIYPTSSTLSPDRVNQNKYYNVYDAKEIPKTKKSIKVLRNFKKLIKLRNRIKRMYTSDENVKLFALKMYFAGPSTYGILRETLNLPSDETLHRRNNIDIDMKIGPEDLKLLELKFKTLKMSDKYCTLCAGVFPVKPNLYYQINKDKIIGFHEIGETQTADLATQVLVILIRGIFSNWKQVLTYCFLAKNRYYKELNSWLDHVISKIISIGFTIAAFVCNQSPIFANLAKERNVSVQKPFFCVAQNKIYYIFDVPYLAKSLRNSLMEHNFEYQDPVGKKRTATWEDICTFYTQDRERDYRLAPKLTDSHIDPDDFEKKEIKYVTDVFSRTVAAAMSCSDEIETEQMGESLSGTADLIELINNTFDVLNASVVNGPNKYKIAFAAEPHQTEVLNKFLDFLSNVIIFDEDGEDVTKTVACLTGFKITIASVKNLQQDLQRDGYCHLLTRRLNLDALDNILDTIKELSGNCIGPTPVQIVRVMKKVFKDNLFNYSDMNCVSDLNDYFFKIDEIDCSNIKQECDKVQQAETTKKSMKIAIETFDYRFGLPENNALLYVCSYLFKKCLEIHKCYNIIQCAESNTVPESFISFVKTMDDCFKCFFQYKILNPVGTEIIKELSDLSYLECCSCFPNDYLKRLFVRFRIFNTLRFNNRLIRNTVLKSIPFSVNDF